MTKVKRDLGVLTRDGYWKNVPDNVFDDDKVTSEDGSVGDVIYIKQAEYNLLESGDSETLFYIEDEDGNVTMKKGTGDYFSGLEHLSNYEAQLENVKKSSGSVKASISFIGDSITDGDNSSDVTSEWWDTSFVGRLRKYYADKYTNVGKGIINFHIPVNSPNFVISGSSYTENDYGIQGKSKVLTSVGATATVTFNGDGVRVYYVSGPVTGNMGLDVDTGGEVIIDTNSGSISNAHYDLTGFGDGDHTLVIRNVDTDIYLIGVEELKGTRGVRVHNCSLWGGLVQSAMEFTKNLESEIDELDADLVIISYVANDSTGGTDLTDYEARLQTIIDHAKGFGADVLLTTMGIRGSASGTQEPYVEIVRQLAIDNDCALYDNFGKWFPYTDAIYNGRLHDGVHLTPKGSIEVFEDLKAILV